MLDENKSFLLYLEVELEVKTELTEYFLDQLLEHNDQTSVRWAIYYKHVLILNFIRTEE